MPLKRLSAVDSFYIRPCLLRCFNRIAVVAVLLGACAPAMAAEPLVFCLEKADVRPWRTKEGAGLNIELLNRVAKQLNLQFSYQGMPWKRCLVQLKANQVHGAIGASFKAERLEMGAYPGQAKPDASKRLNFDRYVLLRRRGANVTWDGKTFRNLEGAVGIQLGYSIGDHLKELGVMVDEGSQRGNELMLKLIAGRIGATAMLDGEASALLASEPKLTEQVEILPVALAEKPYFLMLSHALTHAQPQTAHEIWNAIRDVRDSAAYQKLEREAMASTSK